MARRLDYGAVAIGAGVGIAVLAAAAVVANLAGAADDDAPFLVVALLVSGVLTGLGAAGWTTARRCSSAPLVHGAVAALAAVVAAEAVVLLRQLVRDESVAWAPAVTWLLLGLAAGLAGGLSALRPRDRADSPG